MVSVDTEKSHLVGCERELNKEIKLRRTGSRNTYTVTLRILGSFSKLMYLVSDA